MDIHSKNNMFNVTMLLCFESMITENGFAIKQYETGFRIDLWNDKCFLKFVNDYGVLEGSFADPKEKAAKEKIKRKDSFPVGYPIYPLFSVWKFLYPNDKEDFGSNRMDMESQALAQKRLILARLKNVLHGDFSWTTAYKENDNRISKKVEYMTNYWEVDHPVRIKFNNGDPTWEKAFDEYKNYFDEF